MGDFISQARMIGEFLLTYSWENAYRYFGIVLFAFFTIHAVKAIGSQRRPFPKFAKASQLRREMTFSILTVVITAALAPAILILGFAQNLNFYIHIDTYGWPYLIFSIFLMLFIRDTIFYWQHRIMHASERIYRRVHHLHHRSVRVTPLSGYSVHPFEAIFASALPYVVILFFVPKQPIAYLVFVWCDAAIAVINHLGYEPYPSGFARHWLGRWFSTATAHQTHHMRPGVNFGMYFLIWDRLMGTLDPDYERKFDIATAATVAAGPTS